MSDGWNFKGIQTLDAQDPGPIASGTVPSNDIASWLTENIPQEFVSAGSGLRDPFALRGDAQTPLREANAPLLDPLSMSGPNIFSTRPELGDRGALNAEAVTEPEPYTIPKTFGLGQIPTDPVELALMLGGGGVGLVKGAKSAVEGGLRSVFRTRPGSPPDMEQVAAVLQRVAHPAMRPLEATAEGLSDIVRTKLGIGAVRGARDTVRDTLLSELNAVTAANQVQAAQGLTGRYAAQAAAGVKDLASAFKALTDDLATAGRGMANPQTGVTRPTVGGLASGRTREEVYQEIQQLLSPDQFKRFMASQGEYAEAMTLSRLLKAGKGAVDVLTDRQALQQKAKGMQDALNAISPDILKVIFRGGKPLTTDMPVTLPFGLGMPGVRGYFQAPATILAGPVSAGQKELSRLLGAVGGSVAAQRLLRGAEMLNPFADTSQPLDLSGVQMTTNPNADRSMSTFFGHLNPFTRR